MCGWQGEPTHMDQQVLGVVLFGVVAVVTGGTPAGCSVVVVVVVK